MAELADALASGASDCKVVWVQVPSPAPKPDTNFDTMRILIGVLFLFTETAVYKGFPTQFNESRLYGNFETVSTEPFPFYSFILFNERSWGCAFSAKGCAYFNYSSKAQKKKAHKTGSCKALLSCGLVVLCSDAYLRAVIEHKGDFAVSVDDCLLNHNRPDCIVPFLQHLRLFFKSAYVKSH